MFNLNNIFIILDESKISQIIFDLPIDFYENLISENPELAKEIYDQFKI
jgi:hypothetical protein